MKRILPTAVLLLLLSCGGPEEKIQNLNGYWTIEKVETEDGKSKVFGLGPVVDYIEIENNKGFRKKVRPKFDGTFLVTNNIEKIKVKEENGEIVLYYHTKMDQWKETLVSSEKDEVVFENEQGKRYTYQRFERILNDHGKEEK